MAKKKTKKRGGLSVRSKNRIAEQCVKQIETAFQFKQPRMEEVLLNEDLYHGQALPRLRGRYSVPLPTMGGYVDTLLSKQDEEPTITYNNPDDKADAKAVDLASRTARKVLRNRRMRWRAKDRNQKKLAAFSGVGIGEFFTESDPEYKNVYNVIDHYDFGSEPTGGESLDNHRYCGRINLFKSEDELEEATQDGFYDAKQVEKLINATSDEKKKKNKELFKNKVERFQRYGLDIEGHDYIGNNVYSLSWWGTTWKGKRYLVTLDYETGTWVRIVPLEDVSGDSEMWVWDAWHTHPDEFNFWSKSPCDDLRPVAIAIDIIFNQALDNRQKRNFGMRAYDPSIFPNPEELEWRPDGIVEATVSGSIKQISAGIYEFETPEVGGTVDMIQFMDAYTGRKTGITSDAEGESDETKVGIYYGNLQQVADRLGLYNRAYSEYHESIGVRLLIGMKNHLDEETAIEMLGLQGVETEEIFIEKIKPEWDVEVSGGQAEFRANAVKKQKRDETLTRILSNRNLASRINPDWAIRQLLLNGEWEEDDVVEALDLADTASLEIIGEAEDAIQRLLSEENVPLNRGATAAYIKHIFRFAQKTTFDKDPEKDMVVYMRLINFAQAHVEIAQQNMVLMARDLITKNRMGTGGEETGEVPAKESGAGTPRRIAQPTDQPAPGTPEGTAEASAEATEESTPSIP